MILNTTSLPYKAGPTNKTKKNKLGKTKTLSFYWRVIAQWYSPLSGNLGSQKGSNFWVLKPAGVQVKVQPANCQSGPRGAHCQPLLKLGLLLWLENNLNKKPYPSTSMYSNLKTRKLDLNEEETNLNEIFLRLNGR
jgi:hypothetical protein